MLHETAEQRSERLRKRRERDCAQTASERQATSQQRSTRERERMAAETPEEKDYSQSTPTSTKGWQLKPLRRKVTMDEHQPARKVGS